MKNDSTPSEGWEERFNKLVKEFKDNTVWITHLIFKDFIQEEIAKARQEVMMTELVHCEEAIERARQDERQEIAEWAKRYDKRNDGINKSDLLKELEEE